MHIDIGARDGAEARERVRIGDVAVIDAEPARASQRPARLAGAGQPPRLLRRARGRPPGGRGRRRRAGSSRRWPPPRRRSTFGGSRTSAFCARAGRGDRGRRHPRDRRPGHRGQGVRQARARLGPGAQPRLDRSTTGVFELLLEPAAAEKIPFTVEAAARTTGTDADAVHLSRGGVPTGLVSIPIRYMHSPVELVQLDDVTPRPADRGRAAAPEREDLVRALSARLGGGRRARRL